MTRFLLELITLEKQAGNYRGKSLIEKGKENVLVKFKKRFPITLNWNKVKNRLDTLKKQYEIYPAKLRSHPLRFIPLLDVVFRDETVVVEESWQPRRGVHRRAPVLDLSDSECPNNNGDEREDLMQNRERDHMRPPTPDWMSQTPMENSPTSANSDPPFASQERSSTHTQVKNVSRNRKRKQNPADSTLDRIAATMKKI
ncbi:Myb/SANT-like DNA-binding domain protein [Arabidopsis thaliana]|uniref:Myb/SANT-like DNA-binding domain protein n=1 Tax=Arabidopsis thaliana TaxID=3702 RepID=A0A1P8B324_ARATH|nr:Myb/SANT-like DNA-binding domain protein [Arabidopsis thaliana]ANM63288.1 Myb/SANT-like DNA-binding domain protein [Arabidopsis thaliana]|eukprot:NP_001325385.1 Myb/SANT-like DNA-binding domain protein [Arabidopsis thaliana]